MTHLTASSTWNAQKAQQQLTGFAAADTDLNSAVVRGVRACISSFPGISSV